MGGQHALHAVVLRDRRRGPAKHGVGVDNIDVAVAAARGVTVLNAPGSNTGAVADLAFALLLAAVRRIVPAHAATAAGK